MELSKAFPLSVFFRFNFLDSLYSRMTNCIYIVYVEVYIYIHTYNIDKVIQLGGEFWPNIGWHYTRYYILDTRFMMTSWSGKNKLWCSKGCPPTMMIHGPRLSAYQPRPGNKKMKQSRRQRLNEPIGRQKKIILSCSLARQQFLKIFQIFGHLCLVLVFATCFQYVFLLPFLAIPICSDASCSLKPPAENCILIASPAWHFC